MVIITCSYYQLRYTCMQPLTECISDGGVHGPRSGDKFDLIEVRDEEVVTDVSEAVLPWRGAQQTLDQPDKQDHYGWGQGGKLLQGTLLNGGKKKKLHMHMSF